MHDGLTFDEQVISPMTLAPPVATMDVVERCAAAGGVLLLVPSSGLGMTYTPLLVAELKRRLPEVRVIVADDVLFSKQRTLDGVDEIVPVQRLREPNTFADIPVVNCAYSLPTWLLLKRLIDATGRQTFDLPEVLHQLDITLVYQSGTLMREQTLGHQAEFAALRERLADEHSRKTLDAILRMRMDGNRAPLLDVLCSGEQEYFSVYRSGDHPINLRTDEHYVDVGAYDGDTVKKFMAAVRDEYSSIHAFEPDPMNFTALQAGLDGLNEPRLTLHRQAVSDQNGWLTFSAKGTMGSRADSNGDIDIPSVCLDDVLTEVTLLKMDVEGHEARVLRGAQRLIATCRPRMAITCYHHALDLLDIVSEIDNIAPNAQLRLRHYSMYFFDTILYVEWPQERRSDKEHS